MTESGPDVTGPAPDPIAEHGNTPSGSDSVPLDLGKDLTRDAARETVLSLSIALHGYLARSEVDQAAGLWLAQADDLDRIATPAGSLIARHAGGTDVANPDIADLIKIAAGVGLYLVRNLRSAYASRKAVKAALRADTDTAAEHNAQVAQ